MSFMKQNDVKAENVIASIIIVALIVGLGFFIWSWFAWLFGAMGKWYPMGWQEKVGFFVVGGLGTALKIGLSAD